MDSYDPLTRWWCVVTWQIKSLMTYGKVNAPIKSHVLMTTKLFRVLTYGEAKPIIKLHKSDHVITRGHVSDWKLNNLQYNINPISSNVAILYPLKTSENQRSREIKGETLVKNRLLFCWNEATTVITSSKINKYLPSLQ